MAEPKQAHLDILHYILTFVKYNLKNLFISGPFSHTVAFCLLPILLLVSSYLIQQFGHSQSQW